MNAMTRAELLGLPASFAVDIAARALGISEWKVRDLVNRGELPSMRLGRLLRIRQVDVLALLGLTEMSGAPGRHPEAAATATDPDMSGVSHGQNAPSAARRVIAG